LIFEWDPAKAEANEKAHRVSFQEAVTTLEDPLSTTFPDPDHSETEKRYITIGESASGRILVVATADRGEVVRLTSARRATAGERRFYEEEVW